MCGIVGGVARNTIQETNWIQDSLELIEHRGPDGQGIWSSYDGKVVLGHRRLSIVDLNASSSQPMSKDGYHIVFNGEIYNYDIIRRELIDLGVSFNSTGDTEVVLAAFAQWGKHSLEKFKGMFAFVIFNERENKIFAARDRAGEKPFYYFLDKEAFYFGSELKTILKAPGKELFIDKKSLTSYLSLGFVPGSQCLVEGYKKLNSGNYLTLDLNNWSCSVNEYWSLPEQDHGKSMNDVQLEEKVISLLQNSIRGQLKADVSVGVLLSGGLDSSIIAALASKVSGDVKTFSIGFEEGSDFDESPYAKQVAEFLGTEHTLLRADNNLASKLPEFIKHFDEPIIDSSMFPTWLVTNLVKKHCTVALGGDGGDELFGGYNHYSRLLNISKLSRFIPSFLKKKIRSLMIASLPVGFKGRRYLVELFSNITNEIPRAATYLYEYDINRLVKCKLPKQHSRPRFTKDLIHDLLQLDFKEYLKEDILVKVDRMSMMNSLEMRAPFLDHELISFAFKEIPSRLKVNRGLSKILLKEIGAKLLPLDFNINRKQGFSIPIDSWMREGHLRIFFEEYVLHNQDSLFKPREVKKLVTRHDRGYNNGELLFGLTLLEMWRKEYGISMRENE